MLLMVAYGEAVVQQCPATGSALRPSPMVERDGFDKSFYSCNVDSNTWLTQHEMVWRTAYLARLDSRACSGVDEQPLW